MVYLSLAEETYNLGSSSASRTPYSTDLDVELMCRAQSGDLQAFGLLVERNRKPLITFLRRFVSNDFIAEELAQEVFLCVFRARSSYKPTAKFTTWLFRIASRQAASWLRDKRQHFQESLDGSAGEVLYRRYSDGKPTVEEILLAETKTQEIRIAIDHLPTSQRTAVILHKYRELEYRQIAIQLQCSETAVKSLLFRAYQRLRIRLAHLEHSA